MLHVAFCIVECCTLHATGGTVPVGGMPMLMPRMRSIICRNERSPICDSAIEWHSDRVTFHTQTHRAIVTQAQPSPLWFSPLLSDLARQLAPEYWSALSTAAKERYRASQAKPSQAKPQYIHI